MKEFRSKVYRKASRWVLFTAVLLFCGCSSFQTYKVAPGVNVLALRNIEDVYPVFATTFKADMDLALKTKAQALDLTAKGTAQTTVQELFQRLDQINAEVRNHLVTAYSKYVTALSVSNSQEERTKASEAFDRVQAKVADLAAEVRKIHQQIGASQVNNSSTEWDRANQLTSALLQKVKSLE